MRFKRAERPDLNLIDLLACLGRSGSVGRTARTSTIISKGVGTTVVDLDVVGDEIITVLEIMKMSLS